MVEEEEKDDSEEHSYSRPNIQSSSQQNENRDFEQSSETLKSTAENKEEFVEEDEWDVPAFLRQRN